MHRIAFRIRGFPEKFPLYTMVALQLIENRTVSLVEICVGFRTFKTFIQWPAKLCFESTRRRPARANIGRSSWNGLGLSVCRRPFITATPGPMNRISKRIGDSIYEQGPTLNLKCHPIQIKIHQMKVSSRFVLHNPDPWSPLSRYLTFLRQHDPFRLRTLFLNVPTPLHRDSR